MQHNKDKKQDNPRSGNSSAEPQKEKQNKKDQKVKNDLTAQDTPDNTNTSQGNMGSGQRQDDN
jgi:hypothetical protein